MRLQTLRHRALLGAIILAFACDSNDGPTNIPDASDLGSRANPAEIGQTVEARVRGDRDRAGGVVHLTLIEVLSGPYAWQIISDWSPLTEPPPVGHEYVLAKFLVHVVSLDDPKQPIRIDDLRFEGVRGDGTRYPSDGHLVYVNPSIVADYAAGAINEGFTYFMPEINDRGTLAVFDRGTPGERWFKLR